MTPPVRTVAVIGAGTIGLAWTTLFLAHGLDVRLNTRRADTGSAVREALALFAPSLPLPQPPSSASAEASAAPEALLARLTIEPDITRAVTGADLVQENVREELGLKQELFATVGRAVAPHVPLLSSSSSFSADALGVGMEDPSALLVGHPFNPAHLMPLVELVPGSKTRPETVERAAAFYRATGKTPVTVRRPLDGTPANRLQSALLREAVHLVAEGYLSAEEADAVMTGSLGPRWAAIGPFQAFHLGGGPGGLRRMLGAVGPRLAAEWGHLGTPDLTEETVELLVTQTERAYGTGQEAYTRLAAARDASQGAVLAALRRTAEKAGHASGRAEP